MALYKVSSIYKVSCINKVGSLHHHCLWASWALSSSKGLMALIKWVDNQWWACFIVVHELCVICTQRVKNHELASALSISLINTSSVAVHMALIKRFHNHSYIVSVLHRCSWALYIFYELCVHMALLRRIQSIMSLLHHCFMSFIN